MPEAYHVALDGVGQSLRAQSRAALAQKPQLVVLNKLDIEGTEQLADHFCDALPQCTVIRISAATHHGLEELKYAMSKKLALISNASLLNG